MSIFKRKKKAKGANLQSALDNIEEAIKAAKASEERLKRIAEQLKNSQ